jgi:lipopolysaccharide assembly outer membrane protein LptD (OstA)
MAEIKILRSLFNIVHPRHLIYVAVPLIFSATLISPGLQTQTQGKKRIELKHADDDYIERDKNTGKDWHRLIGNVFLIHNEILMHCDSAHYFPDKNQVIAFSRIHIEQGDTLDITGNYLFYDGSTEQALLNDNVELVDRETHLFTNSVKYDVRNEIAQYTDSGRIINGKNKLTSHIGIYYVSQSLFHFKDSVKIVNPDYVMKADTMDYNTKTETAFFTGPSEMKGDSIYLYCEKGWYDTKNNITRIWKNAVIDNKVQVINGDSLYYEDNSGYGQSFGNVSIIDTTNSIIVKGNYAWYYKKPERFLVTDSAMFIQVSDNDSLFLHADTISAITLSDSAGKEFRLMRAFYGCRVFSKNLQAKCDSLSYSFQDSVIRLYHQPVLWSEENQLTSDTMAIYTKNRQADRMELYYSAFVTSQVDSLRFNQIKGRTLTGHFKNNKLCRINIEGNGESIYYLVDGEYLVGKNSTRCASIEIIVDKGKIQEIYERQSPEGVIDPPSNSPNANNHLEGFSWLDAIRPKKVIDIFK